MAMYCQFATAGKKNIAFHCAGLLIPIICYKAYAKSILALLGVVSQKVEEVIQVEKQRLEMLLGLIPSSERDEFGRYNIAPGTLPWIVRKNSDDGVTFDSCLWGLVPFGSKNANAGGRQINAMCETAHEKPIFRRLLRKRRCLVPADCFYE
jgi:putative SOS response-associated peptidase YedK